MQRCCVESPELGRCGEDVVLIPQLDQPSQVFRRKIRTAQGIKEKEIISVSYPSIRDPLGLCYYHKAVFLGEITPVFKGTYRLVKRCATKLMMKGGEK